MFSSYRSSTDTKENCPPGMLADVVNILIDRSSEFLPHYVSRMPSIIISVFIVVILIMICVPMLLDDKNLNNSASSTVYQKNRWILFSLLLVVVCVWIQTLVANKVYSLSNYTLNKQHFANVFWLQEYMRSFNVSSFM
jgi:hypothetical protein